MTSAILKHMENTCVHEYLILPGLNVDQQACYPVTEPPEKCLISSILPLTHSGWAGRKKYPQWLIQTTDLKSKQHELKKKLGVKHTTLSCCLKMQRKKSIETLYVEITMKSYALKFKNDFFIHNGIIKQVYGEFNYHGILKINMWAQDELWLHNSISDSTFFW